MQLQLDKFKEEMQMNVEEKFRELENENKLLKLRNKELENEIQNGWKFWIWVAVPILGLIYAIIQKIF